MSRLGTPHLHLRSVTSTNDRARSLATGGAPHGTLVTATHQTAGRGRQGRSWVAPAGRALLASVVLRDPGDLLPLAAAIAVARTVGADALIKWPNDVLIEGRKVAGILVEARPQDGWAVLGIGVNVAIAIDELPGALHERAGTLGGAPGDVERVLGTLLGELEAALALAPAAVLDAYRARDALCGRTITWEHGHGRATGVDDVGRLLVAHDDGRCSALNAGEVSLGGPRRTAH